MLLLALPSAFQGMQLRDPVPTHARERVLRRPPRNWGARVPSSHEDAMLRNFAMLDAYPAMVTLDVSGAWLRLMVLGECLG